MKRNMTQWVADLIANEDKRPMPVLSFPAVTLMDISVRELISDSELQARAMALIAEKLPTLCALGFMDLSVEAEAFGADIIVPDGEVPTVVGALVTDEDAADALEIPAVGAGRTGLYIESMQKALQRITDRPVLAGAIGPFSLAGRLMGVEDALVYCFDEPDMVHTIMEKTTRFVTDYILAFKAVGANGVLMAEPLTGLLSPTLAEEFSTPYVKQIVDAVQDDEFMVIYHNCGQSVMYMAEQLTSIGAAGYHFGNAADLEAMLQQMPDNVPIFGNLDPAGQLFAGDTASVFAATTEIVNRCGEYKNFVPSSGCDIPPLTSWDNIDSFFKACHERFYKGPPEDSRY
ncbi:MAG: methyltransferase [Ruminococcaceae bacterium]|nr:methyltransferase [Oscillospiraceae bacterium]